MRSSDLQLALAAILSLAGGISCKLSDSSPAIWFVGATIVLAIMWLTMEVEKKGKEGGG